jgi:hypothetical protein
MQIIHLQHKDIDMNRWDQCISESINQLTYTFSWYLNIVCPGWEALIAGDYEFVMPIPVKRKYHLPYVVQPYFTQQLGVFSKNPVNEEILKQFIKSIPYYSYQLNLNEQNKNSEIEVLPNYILNLNTAYNLIASKYSKNTQRNIEKAHKNSLTIDTELNSSDFIEFYKVTQKNYQQGQGEILRQLIEAGKVNQSINLFGIRNKENELIAALCILISSNRMTYLLPASNIEGKKTSAMFLLIDKIIRQNAEKKIILDFEGSQIEGIARFYKGFGAENQPYFMVKRFRPSYLIGRFTKQ